MGGRGKLSFVSTLARAPNYFSSIIVYDPPTSSPLRDYSHAQTLSKPTDYQIFREKYCRQIICGLEKEAVKSCFIYNKK